MGQEFTHGMYVRRLKKWKQALMYRLVVKRPATQSLSQLSPYLAQIRGEHCPRPLDGAAAAAAGTPTNKPSLSPMEIPGQYQTCTGIPHSEVSRKRRREEAGNLHVIMILSFIVFCFHQVHAKLQGFDPDVDVLYRHSTFYRRICMLGNDGRRYYFVSLTSAPFFNRSDERVMQLHWLVNRYIYAKDK